MSIDFNDVKVYKLKKNLFDIQEFQCTNSEYENYIKKMRHMKIRRIQ